jgi:hypothetical protein
MVMLIFGKFLFYSLDRADSSSFLIPIKYQLTNGL